MGHLRSYLTASDFRRALEDRLRASALEQGTDLEFLRKNVAFERFLLRLFRFDDSLWLLKGGFALELRWPQGSRATRDLDLSIPHPEKLGKEGGPWQAVRNRLQDAGRLDLKDFFQFRVEEQAREITGAALGGYRFIVESRMGGRKFTSFHVDTGLGGVVIGVPETVTSHDYLSFAGIPPGKIVLFPKEQHLAEKFHAYTRPRPGGLNSRVRDLVDMVILIRTGLPDPSSVERAIKETFGRLMTHSIPVHLKPPPGEWNPIFIELADEVGLGMTTMREAFNFVRRFWKELKLH